MNPLILLVDDSPVSLKLISQMLLWEGYRVVVAEDGESARHLIREEQPDLVVLDLELPRLDGLTLVGLLRRDERTRDLPVLALTAHAMKGDAERGLAAGFTAYLTKPIDTRTFCKQIALHLPAGAHVPIL